MQQYLFDATKEQHQQYQEQQLQDTRQPTHQQQLYPHRELLFPSNHHDLQVLAPTVTPALGSAKKHDADEEKQPDVRKAEKESVVHKAKKTHAKTKQPTKKQKCDDINTPQGYLHLQKLLQNQGHSLPRIKSSDTEYKTVPSELQLASFGSDLVRAIHTSDVSLLSALLGCGLSPNPCNQCGDGILGMVCKKANLPIFQCLLDHGCDLSVVDGFGRTPLHHCCWANTFCKPMVEAILERDPIQLLIEDKHGKTPLEYLGSNIVCDWKSFLDSSVSKYFPAGGRLPQLKSPKINRSNEAPPDPSNNISVDLAKLVSSGYMSPKEVAQMDERTRNTYRCEG
jgi:hypothetical protein